MDSGVLKLNRSKANGALELSDSDTVVSRASSAVSSTSLFKRCAIYTRKSSEEGLEQDFNSLDAQREACAAYVQSQRHEGWRLLRPSSGEDANRYAYDDGGLSGGTMERPGLKRLLAAIESGAIDVVVVYKVDRLTRSLADFARIVDVFDRHGVSFVSVTQAFNTTSSMGRLTLNVLLSFAQFEREVTAERIRDKIAASKRKGIWMGGRVPLGYRAKDRKLLIDEEEAKTVRRIFETYIRTASLPKTKAELDAAGLGPRTIIPQTQDSIKADADAGATHIGTRVSNNPTRKQSISAGHGLNGTDQNVAHQHRRKRFSVGGLSALLRNPIYRGKLSHKGTLHEGEHEALIDDDLFNRVQTLLNSASGGNRKQRGSADALRHGRLLKGLLFDSADFAMTTTHSKRKGVVHNYYLSTALAKNRKAEAGWPHRVPASKLEDAVFMALKQHFEKNGNGDRKDCHALPLTEDCSQAKGPVGTSADLPNLIGQIERIDVIIEGAVVALKAQTNVSNGSCNDKSNTATRLVIPIDWKRQFRRQRIGPSIEQTAAQLRREREERNRQTLLSAIARAHIWYDDLKSGAVSSITELASRENRSVRAIRLNLTLAWLAPDIVRAALERRLDPSISATELARALPQNWQDQRSLVGLQIADGAMNATGEDYVIYS
ncbi:MAG: recombinase family protein [Pseudomonadota bacterium]